MQRRKIQFNLVNNSLNAFISAIEIHNKPNIRYRYENTVVLVINSWELILKAFVRKYMHKSIFTEDGKTITFYDCLDNFRKYIIRNKLENKYSVIINNISLINEYRNNIIHFYNEAAMEPIIFSLLTKNCISYCQFMKEFFNVNPADLENIFIMPIGFKLPFNPIDYLKKDNNNNISKETLKFLNNVVYLDGELEKKKIKDSVLVQYNLNLVSVKKQETSDLIVGISDSSGNVPLINIEKKFQIVNDSNAQKMYMSDEWFFDNYSITYKKLIEECRQCIPTFKQDNNFYNKKHKIEQNLNLARERKLYPDRKESPSTIRYTKDAILEIKRMYETDN